MLKIMRKLGFGKPEPTLAPPPPPLKPLLQLSAGQFDVYKVFKSVGGPLTDKALTRLHSHLGLKFQTPQSLRTRRGELVRLGVIRDTGKRQPSASGKSTIIWTLTNDYRVTPKGAHVSQKTVAA